MFDWPLRFSLVQHSSSALLYWEGTCKSLTNARVFLSQPLLGLLALSNCSDIFHSRNSQTPNTSIGFSIPVCVSTPESSLLQCPPTRSHSTNVRDGASGPKVLNGNRTSASLFIHKFKQRLLIKCIAFPVFVMGSIPPLANQRC
jgi:hypothetical protein